MGTMLDVSDRELHEIFQRIYNRSDLSVFSRVVVELILEDELTVESLKKAVRVYYNDPDKSPRSDYLTILIMYADEILKDHVITELNIKNFEVLKLYFRIKEGDFYKYRYFEIQDILHRQLERLYADNRITREEALYNVNLQGMFDLSNVQFDEFKEFEVKRALSEGACITELDTII